MPLPVIRFLAAARATLKAHFFLAARRRANEPICWAAVNHKSAHCNSGQISGILPITGGQ